MAGRDIEILVKARDESGPATTSALRNIERIGKSVNTAFKLQGIGGTIKGAFDIANAASAAFRGDWEAAGEAVKQLPFGIGGIAQSLEPVLAELTGARAEMEAMKALADDNARLNRERDAVIKAQGESKSRLATLREQVEIERESDEFAQRRIRAEQALHAEFEKTAALRKSLHGKGEAGLREQEGLARERFVLANRGIDADEGKKLTDIAVKATTEANEAEVKLRLDAIEEARKWGRERIKVDSEIAEQRLRNAGKTLEAEREQTRRGFAERIAEARSAGQSELAARLETERDLVLRGLKEKTGEKSKTDEKLGLVESRFLTGRGGSAVSGVERNTAQTNKVLTQHSGLLTALATELRDIRGHIASIVPAA